MGRRAACPCLKTQVERIANGERPLVFHIPNKTSAGRGKFQGRYYDLEGKRRFHTCQGTTEAEAAIEFTHWFGDLTYDTAHATGCTYKLSAFIDRYEIHLIGRELQPKTVTDYVRHLQQFAEHLQQQRTSVEDYDPNLREITTEEIHLFLGTGTSRGGRAGYTKRKRAITIRAAFNVAMEWGVISQNPLATLPFVVVDEKEEDHLSQDEWDFLRSVMQDFTEEDQWLRWFIELSYYLDTRLSELSHLLIHEVNFANSEIKLQIRVGRSLKGRRDHHRVLCNHSLNALRKYLSWRSINREAVQDSPYLFCDEDGVPYTAQYLSQRVSRLFSRLFSGRDLSLHNIRHTSITHLGDAEIPTAIISERVGHRSERTTRRYNHSHKEQRVIVNFRNSLPLRT
jgi:integrase